ncbi:hypothetical protein [Thalassotalea sp. PLHSN55]|uniref:hypothetical protein n=1 Tax=Thalassotalea sp. PLHSN55 TaxID=3435888 RepID=UPI003F87AF39
MKLVSLYIFLSIIFLQGCQSTQQELNEPLPLWVQHPPQDDDSTFYGLGSSYNLEVAKSAALQDVAAKLGISLVGLTQINQQLSGVNYQVYINQDMRTKVDETLISQYQIVQTATVNQQIFVMLKVNKHNILNDNFTQLTQLNAKATALLARQSSMSKIVWNYRAQKLLSENIPRTFRYAAIINMLKPSAAVERLLIPWEQLNKSVQGNLAALCLMIQSLDEQSKIYVNSLENHLTKQAIKVTKNCSSKLVLSSVVEQTKLFDYFTYKNTLQIRFTSRAEGNLASNQLVLMGKSMTDFQAARKLTIDSFNREIAETNLWEIIKL